MDGCDSTRDRRKRRAGRIASAGRFVDRALLGCGDKRCRINAPVDNAGSLAINKLAPQSGAGGDPSYCSLRSD